METVKINNIDISSLVISFETYEEMSKDRIIGSTVSKQIKLKIKNKDNSLKGLLDYPFLIGNNSYIVYERPEKWTKLINVTLYDKMILFNRAYDSKLVYPTTIQKQLEEMATLSHVTIDINSLSQEVLNKEVNWYDNTMIMRNYLGFIAECDGKNAFIVGDKVVFKSLALMQHEVNFCSNYELNELLTFTRACYDDGLHILENGTNSGKTIYFSANNSYVTQEDVDRVSKMYQGLSFYSFKKFNSHFKCNLTELITYRNITIMPLTIKCKVYGGEASDSVEMCGDIALKSMDAVIVKINPTVKIKKIETIVDQNKQTLEIIAQEQEGINKQFSQFKLDLDGIKQQVSKQEQIIQDYQTKPDLYVNANLPCQQIYDIENKKFIPDYTVQNLTLTPVVMIDGQISEYDGNNIVWTKRGGDLGVHEIVKNGILTISQNLALEGRSSIYECYIKYNIKGEEYKKSSTVSIELSLIKDGVEGTQGEDGVSCQIVSNARDFITTDNITFTPVEIVLTPYLQGCSYELWQYGYDGIKWENVVNNENGIVIQQNGNLTISSDSLLFSNNQFVILKLVTNKVGVIDTFTISRTIDYKSAIENIEQNLSGVETIVKNNQSSLDIELDKIRTEVTATQESQKVIDDKITQTKEEFSTQITQTSNDLNLTISSLKKEINEMGESTQLIKTYFKATDRGLEIIQSGNETSTLMAHDHFAILISDQEVLQIFRDLIVADNAKFNNSVRVGHIKATAHANGIAYTWED